MSYAFAHDRVTNPYLHAIVHPVVHLCAFALALALTVFSLRYVRRLAAGTAVPAPAGR